MEPTLEARLEGLLGGGFELSAYPRRLANPPWGL